MLYHFLLYSERSREPAQSHCKAPYWRRSESASHLHSAMHVCVNTMSTSGDVVLAPADLKENQLRSKVMIARVRKLQNENEKAKTGPQRLQ